MLLEPLQDAGVGPFMVHIQGDALRPAVLFHFDPSHLLIEVDMVPHGVERNLAVGQIAEALDDADIGMGVLRAVLLEIPDVGGQAGSVRVLLAGAYPPARQARSWARLPAAS